MDIVYTTPKGIRVTEQFLDELFSQVIEPLKEQEGIPKKYPLSWKSNARWIFKEKNI